MGAFQFIIDSLESARVEAANAQDCISRHNIVAARYHIARHIAYSKAAVRTFSDIVESV